MFQFIPGILFPHYLNGDATIQESILVFARAILSSKHTLNRSFVFSTIFHRCRRLFERYFKKLPSYSGDLSNLMMKRVDHPSTSVPLAFMECYLKLIEIGCESCPSDISEVADYCMIHMLQLAENGNNIIISLFLQSACALLSLQSLSKPLLIEQVYVTQ